MSKFGNTTGTPSQFGDPLFDPEHFIIMPKSVRGAIDLNPIPPSTSTMQTSGGPLVPSRPDITVNNIEWVDNGTTGGGWGGNSCFTPWQRVGVWADTGQFIYTSPLTMLTMCLNSPHGHNGCVLKWRIMGAPGNDYSMIQRECGTYLSVEFVPRSSGGTLSIWL